MARSPFRTYDRSRLMRKAAEVLLSRVDHLSQVLTLEQGKPLREAQAEVRAAASIIEWFADEGVRVYGRIVPSRTDPSIRQLVVHDPVGPVAAFTPWNFPIKQLALKISASLAAGCSIVAKAAEETPAASAALVRAFADTGLPGGVPGLVYGNPSEISKYLITHPAIRKITFTGSAAVGRQLAALAGAHMKRATIELGGMRPLSSVKVPTCKKLSQQWVLQSFATPGRSAPRPRASWYTRASAPEALQSYLNVRTIAIKNG